MFAEPGCLRLVLASSCSHLLVVQPLPQGVATDGGQGPARSLVFWSSPPFLAINISLPFPSSLSLCSQSSQASPLSLPVGMVSSQRMGALGKQKPGVLALASQRERPPGAGAQKGLASFVEQRAGKRRDKNTN